MPINIRITLLFLFILHLAYDCFGQENNLRFSHLTTENGLSNGNVICITQDNQGFIWIGTEDGLCKYDGNGFVIYRNSPKDTTSLSSNCISTFLIDNKQQLWVGTILGLNLYNRDKDCFVRFNESAFVKSGLNNGYINNLLIDQYDNIWAGISNGGLHMIDKSLKKVISFSTEQDPPKGIGSKETASLIKDNKGNIWVCSKDVGLLKYNYQSQTFKLFKPDLENPNALHSFSGLSLHYDKNKRLWIGSRDNGIDILETNSGLIKHYNKSNSNIIGNEIYSILQYDEKNYWIATVDGLSVFNNNTGNFINYQSSANSNSLLSNSLTGLYKDKQNTIWISSRGGGVDIYNPLKDKFSYYKNEEGAVGCISHNNITAITEDNENNIWIGTDGGGFNLFDNINKKFIAHRYLSNKNSLTTDKVLAVLADGNGLWIGTWVGGLMYWNRLTNKYKYYKSNIKDATTLSTDCIFNLFKDKEGEIWVANWSGGFCKYNRAKDNFTRFPQEQHGCEEIKHKTILHITQDHNGLIWLGSDGYGVYCYNKKTDKLKRYTEKEGLSSQSVNCVYEDSKKRLFLGTNGGLNYFNRESNSFIAIRKDDGLSSDLVHGILEDKNQNIWISTNDGINRISFLSNNVLDRKFTVKLYKESDGLQGKQFNEWSFFKSSKGDMYFGGLNGLNVFNPDNIKENTTPTPVIITNLLLFNKAIPIGVKGSPLPKQISELKEIKLDYSQSVLTFYYTALNYINPDKNQFAYKMEGFDNDWAYIGSKREATYTNLDPGTYIFRVKAANNDGIWNNEGTSLIIIITPPWWETKIAYAGFILLIIGLFLGIYYIRVNRLRKQKALLEELVAIRTDELAHKNEVVNEVNKLLQEHQVEIEHKNEMLIHQAEELNETNALLEERQMRIEEQAEELMLQKEELEVKRDSLSELNATKDKLFSILAHDLRSPFNTLIGFSDLLYNKIETYSLEKIKTRIGYIRDGARNTFDLLNNLLEWSRSQRGIIHIEPESIILSEHLNRELRILVQQASRKEVEIEAKIIGEEIEVLADPNLIATVIRNLISNAIKFSNAGNTIYITIDYTKDTVIFSVKDQGVGMPPDAVDKLFKITSNTTARGTAGEKGTGLGLLICLDFIAKHNGKIWAESKEKEGSTFSFLLPYKQ